MSSAKMAQIAHKVLVVDDEKNLTVIIQAQLERDGWSLGDAAGRPASGQGPFEEQLGQADARRAWDMSLQAIMSLTTV